MRRNGGHAPSGAIATRRPRQGKIKGRQHTIEKALYRLMRSGVRIEYTHIGDDTALMASVGVGGALDIAEAEAQANMAILRIHEIPKLMEQLKMYDHMMVLLYIGRASLGNKTWGMLDFLERKRNFFIKEQRFYELRCKRGQSGSVRGFNPRNKNKSDNKPKTKTKRMRM
jgi:hypothetical protein